MTNLKNNS